MKGSKFIYELAKKIEKTKLKNITQQEKMELIKEINLRRPDVVVTDAGFLTIHVEFKELKDWKGNSVRAYYGFELVSSLEELFEFFDRKKDKEEDEHCSKCGY